MSPMINFCVRYTRRKKQWFKFSLNFFISIHPIAIAAQWTYLHHRNTVFHVLDCWFIVIVHRLVVCCDSSFSIYSFDLIWFIGSRVGYPRSHFCIYVCVFFYFRCICDCFTNNVNFNRISFCRRFFFSFKFCLDLRVSTWVAWFRKKKWGNNPRGEMYV